MDWIATLMLWIVVLSGLCQLFWAWSLATIARKTGQSTAMEVLAWIPLLQIAPMVATGGGSVVAALLGGISLVVANVALLGVAAFLGDPIGGLLAASGLGLTTLLCIVYFGQIAWTTAVERGCSGWIGLLVFVPLVNFFVYPFLAFHDGWEPPNALGLILGTLAIALSSTPSLITIRGLEAQGGLDPERLFALDPRTALEQGLGLEGRGEPNATDGDRISAGGIDGETIRALYRMQERFDAIARASDDARREETIDLIRSLRTELEAGRESLDDSTFIELTAYLQDAEARLRGGPDEAGGPPAAARARERLEAGRPMVPPPEAMLMPPPSTLKPPAAIVCPSCATTRPPVATVPPP